MWVRRDRTACLARAEHHQLLDPHLFRVSSGGAGCCLTAGREPEAYYRELQEVRRCCCGDELYRTDYQRWLVLVAECSDRALSCVGFIVGHNSIGVAFYNSSNRSADLRFLLLLLAAPPPTPTAAFRCFLFFPFVSQPVGVGPSELTVSRRSRSVGIIISMFGP